MWLVCLGLVLMAWWRLERFRKPDEKPAAPAGPKHPVAAASTLAAAYATFAVWMFVAWYSKHKPLSKFRWGGDGWMGPTTYAGGADKLGHAWAATAPARVGTVMLPARA